MPTIRCQNCNLVNLSTEPQCKRCKQPFIDHSAENHFQTGFEKERDYHDDFGMQMSCIKCGSRSHVSRQNFKKDYINPILYIFFFMGILPGLILISLFKTKHLLSAPFCGGCWEKYRKIPSKEMVGLLAFIGCVFGGIIGVVATESALVMLGLFVVGFVLLIRSQMYKSKNSPKYKSVTSTEVIIADPVMGDLSFAK